MLFPLSYPLKIVFDNKGEVVSEIFSFIEDAVKLGEGVLVHSLKGQSRSCCVLTAYFMKRFVLEYLNKLYPFIDIVGVYTRPSNS
ncbi:MAG: hypothetical protein EOP45_20220 [Sphingobacteriaceae bacterium]|nr:MAG: hypothetical protein EOP45_20220 [Sphingobacteriaceae bacterium]